MFLLCVFLTGAVAQFAVPRCPSGLGGTPQSISGNIQQGKCVGICTYTCNSVPCSITVSAGGDQVSCGAPAPAPTSAVGTGSVPTATQAFTCPSKFPGTGKLIEPNCYECGNQYCYIDGSTIYCVPDGCADPSGAFCPQIPNQPAYTKPYKINPTSCLTDGCTFCCTAVYFCTQTAAGAVSCVGAQPGQCDTGVATSSPTSGGFVPTPAPTGTPPPCGPLVPCTGQSALTCARNSGCPPTLTPACTCCSSDQSIKVVDCVDNSVPTTQPTTVATAAPPPQCGVTSPCASCSHSCSAGFKATCLCCSNSAVTIPPRCDPITIATLEPCDSSKQLACSAVARCSAGQTASCLCDDADEIQKTSCLDGAITSASSTTNNVQTTLASLAPVTRQSTPMAQTRACDPSLQPYCEANSLKACKQMGFESICKCTGSGVIVDKQCGGALSQMSGGSCAAKIACEQQNLPMCPAPARPLCTCGPSGDVTGYSCVDGAGGDMSDASLVALSASAVVVGCLTLFAVN